MRQELREKFIVTADDYGIRQTARPIVHLARQGKLDRVAVLVHYVSPEQARELLETGVKIDLHLELIDFLKSGRKMKESVLLRGINFAWRYSLGRVTAKQTFLQWQQQIERFRELFGRLPDGLNSHEHVHCFPTFFRSFLLVAERYGIQYIRFGRKGVLFQDPGTLVGRVLSALWKRTQPLFAETAFDTSDYFMSFDWIRDFESFCEDVPEGTIELAFHPEREEEYRAIEKYF